MTLVKTSWSTIDSVPVGIVIETKLDDDKGIRNECRLIYEKGLFWNTTRTAYVYYTPTHWRHPDARC